MPHAIEMKDGKILTPFGIRDLLEAVSDYDYETNDLNMMSCLSTGDEDAHLSSGAITLSVTYEDRYRILLCKDKEFANQDEYRFVVLDELSNVPVFYDFSYGGKYLLLPIDSLLDTIDLR